jgi:ribonuclease Z
MVELGTGEMAPRRFFFDLGNGSIKNILGMGVLPAEIYDVFISHLHIDHYADLPYMYPFTATMGRFNPLRVYGPSGARPDLGTKHVVDKMQEMMVWHTENFEHIPVGRGLEIEVTEFDWKDENGLCYDNDGVKVRHWPRSHVKDGASAYRLTGKTSTCRSYGPATDDQTKRPLSTLKMWTYLLPRARWTPRLC